MTENTHKDNLVLIGAKVKQPIRETIETIAKEDERTVSNTVARLLETHPDVKAKLDSLSPVTAAVV